MDRMRNRYSGGRLRATSHVESFRDAILAETDPLTDASVNALYNSLLKRQGEARSATATNLTVTGNLDARVLSWEDNTAPSRFTWSYFKNIDIVENEELGYRVYRKATTEDWDGSLTGYTRIHTLSRNGVGWTDPANLTAGTYSYVVVAYNSGGNSVPQAQASIKITPVVIEGPEEGTVFENTSDEAFLRYTTSAEPAGTTVQWFPLAGDDAALFEFVNIAPTSREIAFRTAPNYEEPSDSDEDSVYEFTLVAKALNGTGQVEKNVEVTVLDVAEKPGPPKSLATARPGRNKCQISWEAADDNGAAITKYQYRRQVGTTGSWRGWFTVSGGGDARSRTVSGLSESTAYTWEVRAYNSEGYGPAASIFQPPLGAGGNAAPDNIGDDEGEPDTPMSKPVALSVSQPIQAGPNPFNSSTQITFLLVKSGPVSLMVYNTAGQIVSVLEDAVSLGAGAHVRSWHGEDSDGRRLASGIYLYRLVADGQVRLGKLALLR